MNYQLIKNTDWKEVEINGEEKEIPVDWHVNFLKNKTKIHSGGTPSKKEGYYGGNIPWITTTDLNNSYVYKTEKNITELGLQKSSAKIIEKDTVLFAMYGASIGKMGISSQKSTTNQSIACIIPKNELNYKYLYYSLYNIKEKIAILGCGNGQSNVSQEILKEFEHVFPPIQTQSSIASILSAQESIIQDIESLISKYESRFQYLSDELLSGRLRVKEVDGEVVLYKNPEDNWKEVEINGEVKDIPLGWNIEKISDLFDIQRGKVLSKDYIQENKGEYPVYSSATENDGCIGYINSYMLDGEYLTWTTDGVYAGTVFYRNGKFNCTNICGTLKSKNKKNNLKSLFYFVKEELIKHVNHIGNSKLMSNVVSDVELLFPSESEQILISQLLTQQEELINKQKELFIKEKQKFDWLLDNLLSGKYLIKE